MPCSRCVERYGGKRPENFLNDPVCAFPAGVFQSDNWQCQTALALRDTAGQDTPDSRVVWDEDQNAAVLPWEGRFIVLGWYKHRGRQEYAGVLDNGKCEPLTLSDAERFLAFMESPRE